MPANKLVYESSPYLKQHAHNPVHWQPYGEEALAEAKRRNCPVIISIGYSTCHWCHVMERESFTDEKIAAYMNENFVCLKVDREERPDVDQVYMAAIQVLTAQGGWPLNAFTLPDGRPFWAGTYFRPEQWLELLEQVVNIYTTDQDALVQQAERISSGILNMNFIPEVKKDTHIDSGFIEGLADQLALQFDEEFGGLNGRLKFPMPVVWQFLMNADHLKPDEKISRQLYRTLDAMAMGGIFDQIGGGFARYSTDPHFKVPHFEKMLYDNAQLLSVYAHAYRQTGSKLYRHVVDHTAFFLQRELLAPEGGFYTALDADSEGEEGKYYVWTSGEIKKHLPDYADLLIDYWSVGNEGFWERGRNILLRRQTDSEFAAKNGLSATELGALVKTASQRLLAERDKRVRPSLDDKILTTSNALAVTGFADAFRATGNTAYRDQAVRTAAFIRDNLCLSGDGILHSITHGKPGEKGFLDDYVYTAEAFLRLYQVTFDEQWIRLAEQLVSSVQGHFAAEDTPLYYYTAAGVEVSGIRMIETHDGVEPSGNAVLAGVYNQLGQLLMNRDYSDRSLAMLERMAYRMESYPGSHAKWASVATVIAAGNRQRVFSGEDALRYALEDTKGLDAMTVTAASPGGSSLPIFEGRFKSGQNFLYECRNHVCDEPVMLA